VECSEFLFLPISVRLFLASALSLIDGLSSFWDSYVLPESLDAPPHS